MFENKIPLYLDSSNRFCFYKSDDNNDNQRKQKDEKKKFVINAIVNLSLSLTNKSQSEGVSTCTEHCTTIINPILTQSRNINTDNNYNKRLRLFFSCWPNSSFQYIDSDDFL